MTNLNAFYDRVLSDSKAYRKSNHGPVHWARVERNGLYLSEFTMAEPTVVRLFAILHDSMRINESNDPEHGKRAAKYAATLRQDIIFLNDEDFSILDYALRWHTAGNEVINDTVAVCWDADRLDLNRVGIRPRPDYLFTNEAKRIAQESDYESLSHTNHLAWQTIRGRNKFCKR